ncbi:RNA-binding protein [Candidatus Roizmanbacteria bacterium]|nr:MAG: RNA-binding protein [Candidatus Roizmanbacteria bacterium]
MSNIVYVGRISADTTEENLKTLFSTVGEVVSVELNRKIGFKQNNDTAYITMTSDKVANDAIATLNNKLVNGSRIRVTEIHSVDRKGHTFFSHYQRRNRR